MKVVLGHVGLSGGDKGGEIAAAQELIQTLGLTGKLFTLDALPCKKNAEPHRGHG
jgi:predicted transposase YbfD/YdcC